MLEPTESCRVAIIGAGKMARAHIDAFADIPGVTLAGIHSRTRARAEALAAEYAIPVVCETIDELYARTRAHLVVVTVNVESMYSVGMSCCAFPWMLLLEKPPGMHVQEAAHLEAMAIAAQRDIRVALNRRFLSVTQAVAAHLAAQPDAPRHITIHDQQSITDALALGFPPAVAAHWMYANSIHLLDYFTLFGRGSVVDVTPIQPWEPASPGMVTATITFASGDHGLYIGQWDGPGPWAVAIDTRHARWEMRPLEEGSVQLAGQRQRHAIPQHPRDTAFRPGFRLQAEQAVAAARGCASASPTLHEAMRTMQLIARIFHHD